MLIRPPAASLLILLVSTFIALGATATSALAPQQVSGTATGQIVSAPTPCGPTTVCQTAQITGHSQPFGPITAVLNDQIDISNGLFVGTGVIRFANGDTVTTSYSGQSAPDPNTGIVTFSETHTITGGTGRFKRATGELHIVGSATPSGQLAVTFTGVLER